MQIHELAVGKKRSKKCIGRGGKRGTYSGRGVKGQKARSGGNVDPLFEGGRTTLVQKLKKLRGFKSPHPKKNTVTVGDIDKKFVDGEVISVATLVERGLVRKHVAGNGVKIVATGKITKKVTLDEGILLTESAQKMIEKAQK
jgi:large subunit ribosomal protein L15